MFFKKKEPEFKYNLGDEVKDTITDFNGVVVRRTQWLNNCNTYGVQPRSLHEGKRQEVGDFDEPQLKLMQKEIVPAHRETGGPSRSVPQSNRI